MTIYDIKYETSATETHFFDRKTMRFFHQTMRDFRVWEMPNGKYHICAPMRDNSGNIVGYTERYFNPGTKRLEFVPAELKMSR